MLGEKQESPQPSKVIVPDTSFPKPEADRALSGEEAALKNDPQARQDAHDDNLQARNLRERFSWIVSGLVFIWMVAIYVLLLAEGEHSFLGNTFQLSEMVMLAALGTVTLNVIGLLVIILKFVFPGSAEVRS